MAKENPDIIIKNTVRVLIECKSRNEWGDVVKYDKRVGGELYMYQSYAEDVKSNSAVFICDIDRFDLSTFVNPFIKQDQKLSKICLVCWNFLDKAQKDTKLFHSLELAMKNPQKFTPQQRIFC
jgi:hypothetical protein